MRYPIQRLFPLSLVICICSASTVLASSVYELTCKNDACHYTAQASFGGGFLFDQITGYCVRDEQFVHVTWIRGEKAPEPIKVLVAETGELIEMYRCPKCRDPFLPIKDARDLKYCPKCHRPTLEYRLIGYLD